MKNWMLKIYRKLNKVEIKEHTLGLIGIYETVLYNTEQLRI